MTQKRIDRENYVQRIDREETMMKIFIPGFTLFALLLFLSCFSKLAKAQSGERSIGFVVTTEGDTLYGLLKPSGKRGRSLAVRFRQSKAEAFVAYTPDELKLYALDDGTRYESHPIMQSPGAPRRFLQLLVDGHTNLYYLRETNGEEIFYLKKEDGELVPMRKKSAAGVLSSQFSACRPLNQLSDRQKRKTYQFNTRAMMGNVITYNECVRPDRENDTYQSFEKLLIRPGFRLGVNRTSITYIGRDYSNQQGFLIGFFFNVGPKGRTSTFSVQPELLLHRKRSSLRTDCLVAPFCVDGTDITVTSLQVPVLLKLRIRASPAMALSTVAGPSAGLVVADQSESFRVNQFEDRQSDFKYTDWSYGLTLGTGIEYRNRYSLEVRVTEARGVIGGLQESSKERLLQFTLGFMR